MPLACRGSVDRAGIRVVHRVVHRPALAVRAPNLPVAAVSVALQDEQALARSHQQDGLRHCSNLHLPTSWVKSRQVRPPGAPELIGTPMNFQVLLRPRGMAVVSKQWPDRVAWSAMQDPSLT